MTEDETIYGLFPEMRENDKRQVERAPNRIVKNVKRDGRVDFREQGRKAAASRKRRGPKR